jgi:uncharacterized protein
MSNSESAAEKRERLRKQLDDTHRWPSAFSFKFIVPNEGEGEARLKEVFSKDASFRARPSRNGRYIAFTIEERVHSAEEVFERYEAAADIPGVISL